MYLLFKLFGFFGGGEMYLLLKESYDIFIFDKVYKLGGV